MSEEKETETEQKDLETVIEEMDILNPEKKEVYRVDSETLKLSQIDYRIIENYKEAFDLEQMENRYSDYLLKYDYIVGDIAYQKLRLRGFFDNHRKGVPIDMKIANLEDYLVEYCSFGSPYFVLERVEKTKEDPESYFKKKKSSKRRGRGRSGRQASQVKQNQHLDQKKHKKSASRQEKNQAKKKSQKKKFQVNPKEKETKKSIPSKVNKSKKNTKKEFEIRKKKD